MTNRRTFLRSAASAGVASLTAPLWLNLIARSAFAQASGGYKAIVLVTMPGGNDGNNTVVPLTSNEYAEYARLRPSLALDPSSLHVLNRTSGGGTYGLHPSLTNVASLYNSGKASIVANVGPLSAPATKQQLQQNTALVPQALLSHPAGIAQWESATTSSSPLNGWGGRIADLLTTQSGSLSPVFDVGPASIFATGASVQAIAVQASTGALAGIPAALEPAILSIAASDATSTNQIIAQAAKVRVTAAQQQNLLSQAQTAGSTLRTQFPSTSFGNALKAIAQLMNGRSVIGASRQIFYCVQGSYDTHEYQLDIQRDSLAGFDAGIGAFMQALAELGLSNNVLVCTHSDFGRSMQANANGGTDHAWGNHQFLFGGGIRGGQIFGSMPALEIGGSSDLTTQGIWIPTTSVTQMTAGIGSWMGLSSTQLASVFPDLANFPTGKLALT